MAWIYNLPLGFSNLFNSEKALSTSKTCSKTLKMTMLSNFLITFFSKFSEK